MSLLAIDAFSVRRVGKGISRAMASVATGLGATDGSLRYVVLTTEEGLPLLPSITSRVSLVPDMPGSIWEQFGLPFFALRAGADIVFTHRECGPLWGPPVVLHVPEDPSIRWGRVGGLKPRLREAYEKAVFRKSLKAADVVLTSTGTTARQLARFHQDLRRPIKVIPMGIDEIFFPDKGVPRQEDLYLLHVGSDDPRDNTLAVVEAYGICRGRESLPPLLIAGEMGKLRRAVVTLVDGLSSESVRLLGRVTDHELSALYAHAMACVQPSLDEGFGFQPLEALASGAPLVVVDTPAVRETVGKAALFVTAPDPALIGLAMVRLVRDPDLRRQLSTRGRERAAKFRWATYLTTLKDTFAELLESG